MLLDSGTRLTVQLNLTKENTAGYNDANMLFSILTHDIWICLEKLFFSIKYFLTYTKTVHIK